MKKIITIILLVLLETSTVQALPNWDIYSDAVIQDGDEFNVVSVYDTPPDHTTVDMLGGWVDTLDSYDQSSVNVSSGTVNTLNSRDSSNVDLFGGITKWVTAYNTSTISVLDSANIDALVALDFGFINISGGTIDHAGAIDSSTINLSGGIISDRLWADNAGAINIYGYDLAKVSSGGHYGYGYVSGEWSDHTSFNIDLNGSETYSNINLFEVIHIEINIHPDTFNLQSKGKFMTCRIQLPEGYSVSDIDPDTILIERRFKSEWKWFNEKQNVVKAKFKRSGLKEILEPGEIELIVSCHLLDGTYFEGKDTIKVIDKGGKKK